MSKDLRNLSSGIVDITGAHLEVAHRVSVLAAYVHEHSRAIAKSIRYFKEPPLPQDPIKTYIRQLERLTRKQPQTSALDFTEPGSYYLKRALMMRKEFDLLDRWTNRKFLTMRAEKIALIRECAPAASTAIGLVAEMRHPPGRPMNHAQQTLIHTWAQLFDGLLGVPPDHRSNSVCRKLMAVCADHLGVHVEEMKDPLAKGITIKKALSSNPKFSSIGIARHRNLPN